MSVKFSISYSELSKASRTANRASDRFKTYANNLDNVYKKLSKYNGERTANIETAETNLNKKITELREREKVFYNYKKDLEDLKDECVQTDERVKNNILKITGEFKIRHGIKDSKFLNTINYYLTKFKRGTAVGRWIDRYVTIYKDLKREIKEKIKFRWNYEGGKEYVVNILKSTGEFLAVIAGFVTVVFFSGGIGIITFIAASFILILGAVNYLVDVYNEERAFDEARYNNDPALARRRRDESTIQDTIRRESDSKELHAVAKGLDIGKAVANTILIFNKISSISKKDLSFIKPGKDYFDLSLKNLVDDYNVFSDNANDVIKALSNIMDTSADILNGDFSTDSFRDYTSLIQTEKDGDIGSLSFGDFKSYYEKGEKFYKKFKNNDVIPKDVKKKIRESMNNKRVVAFQ